jgi:hypothetical protein
MQLTNDRPIGLMGSKGPIDSLKFYLEYKKEPNILILGNKYGLTLDQTLRLIDLGEAQSINLRALASKELSRAD